MDPPRWGRFLGDPPRWGRGGVGPCAATSFRPDHPSGEGISGGFCSATYPGRAAGGWVSCAATSFRPDHPSGRGLAAALARRPTPVGPGRFGTCAATSFRPDHPSGEGISSGFCSATYPGRAGEVLALAPPLRFGPTTPSGRGLAAAFARRPIPVGPGRCWHLRRYFVSARPPLRGGD